MSSFIDDLNSLKSKESSNQELQVETKKKSNFSIINDINKLKVNEVNKIEETDTIDEIRLDEVETPTEKKELNTDSSLGGGVDLSLGTCPAAGLGAALGAGLGINTDQIKKQDINHVKFNGDNTPIEIQDKKVEPEVKGIDTSTFEDKSEVNHKTISYNMNNTSSTNINIDNVNIESSLTQHTEKLNDKPNIDEINLDLALDNTEISFEDESQNLSEDYYTDDYTEQQQPSTNIDVEINVKTNINIEDSSDVEISKDNLNTSYTEQQHKNYKEIKNTLIKDAIDEFNKSEDEINSIEDEIEQLINAAENNEVDTNTSYITIEEHSVIEPSAIEPSAIEPSAIEPSTIEPSAIEVQEEPSAIEPKPQEVEPEVQELKLEEPEVQELKLEEPEVKEESTIIQPEIIEQQLKQITQDEISFEIEQEQQEVNQDEITFEVEKEVEQELYTQEEIAQQEEFNFEVEQAHTQEGIEQQEIAQQEEFDFEEENSIDINFVQQKINIENKHIEFISQNLSPKEILDLKELEIKIQRNILENGDNFIITDKDINIDRECNIVKYYYNGKIIYQLKVLPEFLLNCPKREEVRDNYKEEIKEKMRLFKLNSTFKYLTLSKINNKLGSIILTEDEEKDLIDIVNQEFIISENTKAYIKCLEM